MQIVVTDDWCAAVLTPEHTQPDGSSHNPAEYGKQFIIQANNNNTESLKHISIIHFFPVICLRFQLHISTATFFQSGTFLWQI